MKQLYIAAAMLISSLSFGQNLLTESFPYVDGQNIGGNATTQTDNVGNNNWTTISNTTGNSGEIKISAGNLDYNGFKTSEGNKVSLPGNNSTVPRDIARTFSPASTSNVMYMSFLINVLDNTQLSATDTGDAMYFTGIRNTTFLGARVGAMKTNSDANYVLTLQNISSGTPTRTQWAQNLDFGKTYLVVVKYDRSTTPQTATLWVNPSYNSLGGSEPTTETSISNNSGTGTLAGFDGVYLRNAANTPKAEIDEIRVGTTWADVTPQGTLSVAKNQIDGFGLYPNPVVGQKFVVQSKSQVEKNVSVFDLLGKEVFSTKTISEVQLPNIPAGIYLVKVVEQGKTSIQKLVIQ